MCFSKLGEIAIVVNKSWDEIKTSSTSFLLTTSLQTVGLQERLSKVGEVIGDPRSSTTSTIFFSASWGWLISSSRLFLHY